MGQEMLVTFKRHLADCPDCFQEARYTQKLLMVVRQRVRRAAPPRRLRERILARLPHRRDLLT